MILTWQEVGEKGKRETTQVGCVKPRGRKSQKSEEKRGE